MLTFWSIKVSFCVTTSSRGRKADYIDVISTNTLDVAYKSTHILRRYLGGNYSFAECYVKERKFILANNVFEVTEELVCKDEVDKMFLLK